MIIVIFCIGGFIDLVSEDLGEDGDFGVQIGFGVLFDQDGVVLYGL